MDIKSKYFLEKNFIVYLTGKIISSIFVFASIPLFIKYFGVAEYGKFSLLYTTFLMFLAGASGWIIQGILRFYTVENDKKEFLQETTNLTFKSSIITSIILSIVFLINGASLITIIITIPAFLAACLYSVTTAKLQATFESKKVIFSDIIRLIIYFLVPLLLYLFNVAISPEKIFFIGVFLSYLGALLMVNNWKIPVYRNQGRLLKWSNKIWAYGVPLSIWMFLSPTMNSSDRYIISTTLGVVALGEYSAVFDIVFKIFSQLSSPYNNIVQPLLINSYNNKSFLEFQKIMTKSAIYLMMMFLGVFFIIVYFRDFIITDYLNLDTKSSPHLKSIIIPLLISSFFWQIAVLIQKILEIQNKTKIMAIYMIVSVVSGLGISIYFVPRYGYVASAYTMLFSSILYLFLILTSISTNNFNKKNLNKTCFDKFYHS